jgi:hypothetical protein
MQVQTRSGDLSADVARALRWTRDAEPGSALPVVPPIGAPRTGDAAVRLQDLLDVDAPLDVTLHGDFTWWLAPEDAASPRRTPPRRRPRRRRPWSGRTR